MNYIQLEKLGEGTYATVVRHHLHLIPHTVIASLRNSRHRPVVPMSSFAV